MTDDDGSALLLNLADRPKVHNAICGALRNCLNAHGSITHKHIDSAFKRVYGALRSLAKEQRQEANAMETIGKATGNLLRAESTERARGEKALTVQRWMFWALLWLGVGLAGGMTLALRPWEW